MVSSTCDNTVYIKCIRYSHIELVWNWRPSEYERTQINIECYYQTTMGNGNGK